MRPLFIYEKGEKKIDIFLIVFCYLIFCEKSRLKRVKIGVFFGKKT